MMFLLATFDPFGVLEIVDLLKGIYELATNLITVLAETTLTIDSIKFDDDQPVNQYLGYAKYVMTTPLYTLFTSMILASIGLTIYTYFLKGLNYLKVLLPW